MAASRPSAAGCRYFTNPSSFHVAEMGITQSPCGLPLLMLTIEFDPFDSATGSPTSYWTAEIDSWSPFSPLERFLYLIDRHNREMRSFFSHNTVPDRLFNDWIGC